MATASDRLGVALVTILVGVGCSSRAPAPSAVEPSDAQAVEAVQAVVREVVESMRAHECARLEPLIDGALRARLERRGGCGRVVQNEPESMDLTLVRMSEPRRDGRDPTAWLVPVVLRGENAEEQTVLMRVQRAGGRYRVVAM